MIKIKPLSIFRDTQEIHRVLLSFPLGFSLSLGIFVYNSSPFANPSSAEITTGLFIVFFWMFAFLFAVVTDQFNPLLHLRQLIAMIWAILAQGLIFGTEGAGTLFFNIVSLISTTALLPFVLGVKYSTINDWVKNVFNKKKKPLSVVRHLNDSANG